MSRACFLGSALLLVSCGATASTRAAGPRDEARVALARSLCEPLPRRAYDCVVGWPASASPDRRGAILSASDGSIWARSPGVRAFASCADRPAADGPVAHVVVILVDTSVATAEDVAERLPVRVRWTEECEGSSADCASYFARAEEDRLVLTRRVPRPVNTTEDVAHLACAALEDGAQEAHARIDEEDALIRELRVDDAGVAVLTRRPGGRGGMERTHRTWTELELGATDVRIEHDAALRTAASTRAMDPEEVDVTNVAALDAQLDARQRRLARDRSAAMLRALARLAERGFDAHPSRPDLAQLAIETNLEAGEADTARTELAALARVLGDDSADVARLAVLVAVALHDEDDLDARLTRMAPDLAAGDVALVAAALFDQLGAHAMDARAIATAPDATRAFFGAVRASHVAWHRRSGDTIAPASGTPWAIDALSSERVGGLVAVCSERTLATSLAQESTWRGATMTMATLGTCGVAQLAGGSTFDLGAATQRLLDITGHDVRIVALVDGELVGFRGHIDDAHALHVDGATTQLAHAELGRVTREVVEPLSRLPLRMFPAPVLTIPMPEERRAAAMSASRSVEGVDCDRALEAVVCSLDSGETEERLLDVARAMYRAH